MAHTAGLVFFSGDSDPGSLNPAMAFTMLLLKYAPMASSNDKANRYTVSFDRLTGMRYEISLYVRHSRKLR